MDIILLFVVGIIVFIIAVITILKGVTNRIKSPNDELKEEIKVKKTLTKVFILVTILSVLINIFFTFHYYQEYNNKKYDLRDKVERISIQIHDAASRLTSIDANHPDNKYHIIAAMRDITESRLQIESRVEDMSRNLVSWIGGIEGGLSNGAYGIDEEGFKITVQNLKNFSEGYYEETKSINISQNALETLKIMENVLSSKKYMGDNYIIK